jgi:hypothetical protein
MDYGSICGSSVEAFSIPQFHGSGGKCNAVDGF